MKAYILEDNELYLKHLIRFLEKRWYDIVSETSLGNYKFVEADIYLIDLQVWDSLKEDLSIPCIEDIRKNTDALIVLVTHHLHTEMWIEIVTRWLKAWANDILDKMDINLYSVKFWIFENRIWKHL